MTTARAWVSVLTGVAALCSAASAGTVDVKLRPSYLGRRLLVEADGSGAGVADDPRNSLRVSVVDPDSGKTVATGEIGRSRPHVYDRGELSIADLPPGRYVVRAELRSPEDRRLGEPVTRELRIPEKPPWYDSRAGVSDEVLPPWTPLTVEGTTVRCLGREYRFAGSAFPAQIVSAGKEMLAGPIAVRAGSEGRPVEWRDRRVQVHSADAHVVVLRAEAEAELLSLAAEMTIAYDGLVKVACTVTAKRSADLDGLTVVVPLRRERALYFNSPWATRFGNPLEYSGHVDREGWQWKSKFVASLSLRDDDRGLDWACESDEGWRPYDRPDVLRVLRRADRVTLEVAVLGPARIEKGKPLRFSMMFQALPVRPLATSHHRRHLIHLQGGPDKDGQTWEVKGFGKTAYPIRGIERAAQLGVNALTFHELWSDGFGRPKAYRPDDFTNVVKHAHKLGMNVIVYYGGGSWADSPEYATYRWDWDALPRKGEVEGAKQAAPGRRDMRYIGMCPRGNRYLNYVAHGLAHMIERYGIDGVYIDGGEAFPCANAGHGCGYVDEATGWRRPTWVVLANREMRKRFYTILHTNGRTGLIEQHLPYGQTAPIHAFTDTYLAGEPLAHYMRPDHVIPSAWMRQEFTGRQFGVPGEILIYRNSLIDKYMAAALVHGAYPRVLTSDYVYLQGADLVDRMAAVWKAVDDFGLDGAVFLPYWRDAHPVRSSPEAVKVSLYKRDDKGVLAVVANLGQADAEATLKLDLAVLGLSKAESVARDCLPAGGAIRLEGDELTLRLKAETVRLVWLRPADE